jgi:cytosine deaminase
MTTAFDCFEEALRQAEKSLAAGGVPVGATLADDGRLIASGHNERVQAGDPIAHGEISCLRHAGRRVDYSSLTLYTTLAPCEMCTGAILLFGIPRVIIGEDRTFPGALELLRSRSVEVTVLDDDRCVKLMTRFQELYPGLWAEDIGQAPTH